MNRRKLLIATGASMVASLSDAKGLSPNIQIDGVRLQAWHRDERLFASFSAPTRGWLAVGFNNFQRFEGSRFVIGHAKGSTIRIEEHIAIVPDHVPVQELGLQAAVQDASIHSEAGRSRLEFSWPHRFADTDNPSLDAGQLTFIMLAWSQEPDFDHHSAWRRHFWVRL
jgi:hypothetical protein